MGNEDISKRLDSSQEALDHTDSNPLAADEVISDLIRDIWGEDLKKPSNGMASEDETAVDSVPASGSEAAASADAEDLKAAVNPDTIPVQEPSPEPEEAGSPGAPEIPDPTQSLTTGAISAAMASERDPAPSEESSDPWYHYAEDDQELDEESETLPETSKKPKKPKKKRRRRRHPVLNAFSHGLLVFFTVFSLAYLVAVYSDIPLVTRVRTMYIQSAMNTLNHKWMATAVIPGPIIDNVMRTQYEAAEAAIGVESNWGSVDVQELPVLEAPVIVPAVVEDGFEIVPDSAVEESSGVIHESDSDDAFYGLFWELDRTSFREYLDKYPETLNNGWYGININEAGLDDAGTTIKTIYGDEVLAVNAKDGIILIRVWLSENQSRGILAICKDTSRLSLCPADTLGVIGQTAGRICESNGGILAITGSAFIDPEGVGNGGEISGLAVCSGKVFGSRLMEDSKRLELRNDQRMYIMDSASELGAGTRDACEFQPAMIVDGTILETTWNGLEPRAVLGQSEKLETMMVILEGRYADSLGCGVEYVAAKMRQYGCVQAMNLDGGTSAIMYYDGEYVTRCSNPDLPGGRTLPTAWVYKPAR